MGPFFSTVQDLEKKLSTVSEVIEEWLIVQKKWLYLEIIFFGSDIKARMPEETGKFFNIDNAFKKVTIFIVL